MKVCVIGSGIVGLSCAHQLVKRGASVTVIDPAPTHKDRCSWGNAGIVVPSHIVPLASPGMVALGARLSLNPSGPLGFRPTSLPWLLAFAKNCSQLNVDRNLPVMRDLGLAGLAEHVALSQELGTTLHQNGSLMVCESSKTLDHEAHTAEQAASLGLDSSVLTAQECEALVGTEINAKGAVRYHCDAHIEPEILVEALQAHLLRQKVEFVTDTIGSFEFATGNIRAAIGRERYTADAFVLANGAWAGRLAKNLRLHLPVVPGRGQSFMVPAPADPPQTPMVFMDSRVAVTTMGQSVRFAGTMEIGIWSHRPNMARAKGMAAAVAKTLPAYAQKSKEAVSNPATVWVGHRPCAPDGLPLIGPSQTWHNLHIATGHAMLGLSLGPVTGCLVAQGVFGETLQLPVQAFAPERFK